MVLCVSVVVLFILRLFLETSTLNCILNLFINPQVDSVKDHSGDSRDSMVLQYLSKTPIASSVFVVLTCLVSYFVLDRFSGTLVILYFSFVFIFSQFYSSAKTIAGFSRFLESFLMTKTFKNRNLVLNKLVIFNDKSVLFDLLKITLVPIGFCIVTERVTHLDFDSSKEWLLQSLGEFSGLWLTFFGFLSAWVFNMVFLILASNEFGFEEDESSSNNLQKSIDLKHNSHPTNMLFHFYDKVHRVINCVIFLAVAFGLFVLNRDHPESLFYFMVGVSLLLFNKVTLYKLDFNHVFRYKKIKRHSIFNGNRRNSLEYKRQLSRNPEFVIGVVDKQVIDILGMLLENYFFILLIMSVFY